jgi:hypothetical protein
MTPSISARSAGVRGRYLIGSGSTGILLPLREKVSAQPTDEGSLGGGGLGLEASQEV